MVTQQKLSKEVAKIRKKDLFLVIWIYFKRIEAQNVILQVFSQ